MLEYLWSYGLILVTFVFLLNWHRRLKRDLESIESTNLQYEKQTIQLGLIINLLAAIFVSLTFVLVFIIKGLYSEGNLL
jgi:hypothetical protein